MISYTFFLLLFHIHWHRLLANSTATAAAGQSFYFSLMDSALHTEPHPNSWLYNSILYYKVTGSLAGAPPPTLLCNSANSSLYSLLLEREDCTLFLERYSSVTQLLPTQICPFYFSTFIFSLTEIQFSHLWKEQIVIYSTKLVWCKYFLLSPIPSLCAFPRALLYHFITLISFQFDFTIVSSSFTSFLIIFKLFYCTLPHVSP